MAECFYFLPCCPKKKYDQCTPCLASSGRQNPGFSSWNAIPPREKKCYGEPTQANAAVQPVTTSTSTASGSPIEFTLSEYGQFIPIVFGSDKLNGNVFWYSGFTRDYFEDAATNELTYYSKLSFAVGICEGEIADIIRIWVGDKVVYDRAANVDANDVITAVNGEILTATVDLISEDNPLSRLPNSSTTSRVRIFPGSETQLPIGSMVDVEGYTLTPAYRGLAYLLLENLVIAEGTIPPIFVEVLASEDTTIPRAYGTFNGDFDSTQGLLLHYMPDFDRLFIDGKLGTAFTGSSGFITYKASDMSDVTEYVLPNDSNSAGIEGDLGISFFTSTFKVVRHYNVGNNGKTSTFDLATGTLITEGETRGGISAHVDGLAATIAGCPLFQAQDTGNGEIVDYVLGVGQVNSSVGLYRVNRDGQLYWVGTTPTTLPHTNNTPILLQFNDQIRNLQSKFSNDRLTDGLHFLVLSHATNEEQIIDTLLVTLLATETTGDPIFAIEDLGGIDLDAFVGRGNKVSVQFGFYDPNDGNVVFNVLVNNNESFFVKWSPFTAAIIWRTKLNSTVIGANAITRRMGIGRLVDSYCFIDAADQIVRIDLSTGEIKVVVEDLQTDQNLPALRSGTVQYYDGISDSIFYLSSEAGTEVVRIYISRASRTGYAVSNIVRDLLERVGVYKDQIEIDDVETLSVKGYTIDNVRALRSIFQELAAILRFDVVESDGGIVYRSRGGTPSVTIEHEDLRDTTDEGWLEEHQEPDFAGARKINLTYRDIGREFTRNLQSFTLPKYTVTSFDEEAAVDVSVPVVLTSEEAKELAEILLYSKIVYSSTFKGQLPLKYIGLDPSDVVTLERDDTSSVTVRMREVTFGQDRAIEFQATLEDPDIYTDTVTLFGNTGRYVPAGIQSFDDLVEIVGLDLPFFSRAEALTVDNLWPNFATVLNYTDSDFPPFALIEHYPEDPAYKSVVVPPSTYPTWGYVSQQLSNIPNIFSKDTTSELRVKMQKIGTITPASAASYDAMVLNENINMALVGRELIQFQTAAYDSGTDEYVFTNLHRGKYGTDRYAAHRSGERFILLYSSTGELDSTAFLTTYNHDDPHLVDPDSYFGGCLHRITTRGVSNNPNPNQQPLRREAYSYNLIPWVVGDFQLAYSTGDAVATWSYRDRLANSEWLDGDGDEAAATLREDSQSYTVYWYDDPATFDGDDPATYLRTATVTTQTATYAAADQTTDGFDNSTDTLYCHVVQNGSDINTTPWFFGTAKSVLPV